MSRSKNIEVNLELIRRARALPCGSEKRIQLFHWGLAGVVRALLPAYNPNHYEGV